MTIKNREIFYRDPTDTKIPNDGVAKVFRPETDQQWDVLRWELRSFVCDGQYARGLERILDSFLKNMTQSQQPAVWVSGFYGSGKSHLVRVLEYLWRDVELPGGDRAWDLVTLPDEVRDHLTELSTAGKRLGGLWSAAGTLAAGKSSAARLAFLSVLFESAGLPEEFARARFTIWARENQYLDTIEDAIKAQGRTFSKEIHDLYVSPIIAQALLEADPSLGDSTKDVRELLKTQFPPTTRDITDDEMFDVVEDVLRLQSTTAGKLPLTLVVLDEMQQYIDDDNEKALTVQNIVEGCSARFESQMLFVATGQSALTATPTLQKLTDRFAVQVALSDKDVESVVRQVVLRKKPEHVAELKSALDDVSGEIDQQLGGTQIAPKGADKPVLAADYPLLPTRRRFWELALRAIDRAGKAGVLRTQLRIVHEAAGKVANRPLGNVVGADFLYDEQAPGMLQSGVLLKEIDELIAELRDSGGNGEMKARILALVFLITQIPSRTVGGETGLRATVPLLTDLLIEDLASDRSRLHKRVPELLDELVNDGRLMWTGDEYQLQTEEGAEWEKDYRGRLAAIRDDAARITQLRTERLSAAVDSALAGLKLVQGLSKTPRKIQVHWGQTEPAADEGEVPIWIRDEWSVTESAVRRVAAEAGDESPTVFVLLPKHEPVSIKDALASFAAAADTLRRPTPQTDEGRTAQQAMRTRLAFENDRLEEFFRQVVTRARVFQGGGAEVTTSTLREGIDIAANRSLIRLFPKFNIADSANWDKVVTKAREGAPDALEAVGYHGEPAVNAVCKEILAAVNPSGSKGADLHRQFTGPRYGWPRDAVNGALLTLLSAGNIRAVQDGKDLAGPREVQPTQIGKVSFYREDEPPSVGQRLAVKGLLAAAGIPYESGQEGTQIPALLQHLKDLAAQCGGEPPLPQPPSAERIEALLTLSGNLRFRSVADDHEQLSQWLTQWQSIVEQRKKREMVWNDLQRLVRHAQGLAVATELAPALEAVRESRQLLDDPDPVTPIRSVIEDALRAELQSKATRLAEVQRAAVAELESWASWGELNPADQATIIEGTDLNEIKTPDVSSSDKLLQVLDDLPLKSWNDRIAFVPGRRDQARFQAAKLIEPESISVQLPSATIRSAPDLETYLDDVRKRVKPHIDANKTVII
ncbi:MULTISPECIES: BREX system P-loop protein BrxC [Mycobacteriaceae]|uniref:BREX system P-loop protein BrxC n=1 Tax=Mycolicibacterium parafortuitum TaxID=39692 RepID=A0ACC6ME70_MYCPF|nr:MULTISPECIES: BREX system P-loop protein BrxC [Mycobacteriaceae]MDZ5085232.1 BREX system P-loop protein BrxC [Mycolicibacterium parafortuitum]GFM17528.1 putative P-loop containing nucleoside triphospha te hydrolase [Mycobacterium sp. PO1]GFM21897.1 putative P-loop containing nucleoside triphospha te hydrolase [Mycobacterium sp. PO2]